MYHATTMNRDGDPASLAADPDYSAFDAGPGRGPASRVVRSDGDD
jgi:glycerol-3-phosphate dehydrogenase